MGQLFGKKHNKNCCCNVPTEPCDPCPPGTIYPWLVDVSFPGIGVTVQSANELDEDQDGELTFVYRVEGSYGGYSFQCLFGDCEASVSVIRDSDSVAICIGGGAYGTVTMTAVSCPPEAFILVYSIPCAGGGSISVVITG